MNLQNFHLKGTRDLCCLYFAGRVWLDGSAITLGAPTLLARRPLARVLLPRRHRDGRAKEEPQEFPRYPPREDIAIYQGATGQAPLLWRLVT